MSGPTAASPTRTVWPRDTAPAQIDDITVYFDDELITFDDFEAGSPVHWVPVQASGVGDFAHLRNELGDIDPCRSNTTYQVNFIDDGVVVPGTGGTALYRPLL